MRKRRMSFNGRKNGLDQLGLLTTCAALIVMTTYVSTTLVIGAEVEDQSPSNTRRHALLVGCTKYPSLVKAMELYGPENDVELMRELLTGRFGFTEENITTLSETSGAERRPTRGNIEREFHRLAAEARSGDLVVILLAGHGSQQPDDDPENADDRETDGLDEIFLPADIGQWERRQQHVENAISDDELRGWLQAIRNRGAFVWVIVDACHSGTMIRGADEEVLRQVPPETLVPKEALAAARHRAAGGERTRGTRFETDNFGLTDSQGGVVALYAAQSSEPTIEKPLPPDGDPRRRYGLLSYTINQVLTRAQTPLTYRELGQRVHDQYMRWGRHFPTPLLEGTHLDREVLGKKDWHGRSLIRLSGSAASGYLIDAGALHGVTKGSVLEVRAPAGGSGSTSTVGHVRIRRIQPLQSFVEPCAYADVPLNEELPNGGDCRLVYLDYGQLRLRIAVDPTGVDSRPSPSSSVSQVTAALKQLAAQAGSFVEPVDVDAEVDWLARIGEGQVYLVPAGGWAVPAGASAKHAAPPMFGPAPLDGLADWLDERLSRIARVHNLLKLDGGESGVITRARGSVDVDIDLLRYASEQATDFEVVPWNNQCALRAGEIVQFRVTNKGEEPVDVTLLFVDSEYGITAYFPQTGFVENNRIDPKKQFFSPRAEVTATDGPEHMVVIAVRAEPQREPVNFSFLEQPSIERARGTRGSSQTLSSPLGELVQSAMFAEGATRGLSRASIDNHAVRRLTWSVVETND